MKPSPFVAQHEAREMEGGSAVQSQNTKANRPIDVKKEDPQNGAFDYLPVEQTQCPQKQTYSHTIPYY